MMPPGESRDGALQESARSWARFDPAGALAWAAKQPDEGVRRNAIKTTTAAWFSEDPASAGQWIRDLPADGEKDVIVSDAASVICTAADLMPGDSFGELAQLIGQISDPQSRASANENLAIAWLKKDREAASAWIDRSSRSPSAKARLLTPDTAAAPLP
ncbi:MAG: hypothetical protein ABI680_12780 [Chthoniobacteraceae bacterium]